MAGHRRNSEVLLPRQRVDKLRRRRETLVSRMAAAHTPDEQFMAAVYYVRSVIRVVPDRHTRPVIDTLTDALIEAVDDLAARWSREGGKPQ
jgi:hypothetical protein